MLTVFLIIAVVVGIGATFNAVKDMRRRREFNSRAVRVSGVVVDLKWKHTSGAGRVAMPIFNYYTREGHPMQATETVGTNPPRFRPGHQVVVLYDSREPYRAHLEGMSWVATGTQVMAMILGPIFAVAGLVGLAVVLL
ncbi:DUF3592 domain-containing protein [Dactylosporangium sp. AC04546]|uniref:DUF3592 domain-containing protein n=1 Tax=Dactylosporangium sp. AC04546 TaxID=2862460 RepID=UPI001EDD3D10|nr:DUF3592 domain-containing protein [Dactylosporangium sp. AC04546]WVK82363.1 DUF3592 domain-containing protein [Dactylosporangium sp. AC04546]